jgi:hypothetical protein
MLRTRWTVLAVCVLLLMAFPQSVCLADIGIPNGDFSSTSTLPPLPWDRTEPTGSAGILSTDIFHSAPRSLGVAGTNDISYCQCIDTSTWSGRVQIGGWVYMNGDAYDNYDSQNGSITVTWYAEAECGGDASVLPLSLVGGLGTWAHLSASIDLPATPRATYVSMKVVLFGKGGETVYLDDIYATAMPTAVSIGQVTARPGALPVAALVAGVASVALYWRRRGRPFC